MKIIEFFKALVLPSKMAKYRMMSVFFSIMIFILSFYLIAIPVRPYIKKNMDKLIDESNYLYLQAITDLETISQEERKNINTVLDDLVSKECRVDENYNLVCEKLPDESIDGKEKGTFYKTEFQYYNEEREQKIHFDIVIDTFAKGKSDPQYYPSREFVYSYDKFPDIDHTEYYLLVFWKDSIYYQAHPMNIQSAEVKHGDYTITTLNQKIYYINVKDLGVFDFTNFKDSNGKADVYNFTNYLMNYIKVGHIPNFVGQYSLSISIFTIIFTLIISFLFWIIFKKNGKLKKLKEYYNIAAMCNILPSLIIFILMWIEINMLSYYIFLFSVYYLFMLYKINNNPKIA